jgi:hypothetical protein
MTRPWRYQDDSQSAFHTDQERFKDRDVLVVRLWLKLKRVGKFIQSTTSNILPIKDRTLARLLQPSFAHQRVLCQWICRAGQWTLGFKIPAHPPTARYAEYAALIEAEAMATDDAERGAIVGRYCAFS